MAASTAYGSSQARDWIPPTAGTYAVAAATLDPLTHCPGLGIKLVPLQQPIRFLIHCTAAETPRFQIFNVTNITNIDVYIEKQHDRTKYKKLTAVTASVTRLKSGTPKMTPN